MGPSSTSSARTDQCETGRKQGIEVAGYAMRVDQLNLPKLPLYRLTWIP